MNQREAVIEVMKANGGFATFEHLYVEVFKIPGVEWKSKTPFASIRRIVQDKKFFFKIRPGFWALKEYKNRISLDELIGKQTEFDHTYYQGLLVKIGNLEQYQTFVPNQDKNKMSVDKRLLSELTTIPAIHSFSYDHLVKRAQTIDVIWFNRRGLPYSFFEVENSTDFQNSLGKFVDLQDFNVKLCIVADIHKKKEFDSKLSYTAYESIAKRVNFLDYDRVVKWYDKAFELNQVRPQL